MLALEELALTPVTCGISAQAKLQTEDSCISLVRVQPMELKIMTARVKWSIRVQPQAPGALKRTSSSIVWLS